MFVPGNRTFTEVPPAPRWRYGGELVPRRHVREEVAHPGGAAVRRHRHAVVPRRALALGRRVDGAASQHRLGLRVEIVALAVEQAWVLVRVVEEEVGVRHDRHGHGHVVVVQQPRWLIAAGVRELRVCVARHVEHRVRGPLEARLGALARPDAGEAGAGEHVDRLSDGHLERRQRHAGRDLDDPGLAHALHALELEEGGVAPPLLPPAELDLAQVGDVVAAVDRDADRLDPPVVDEVAAPPLARCLRHGRSSSG